MDPQLQAIADNIRKMAQQGATTQEVDAYLKMEGFGSRDEWMSAIGRAPESKPKPPLVSSGLARNAVQGLTFNFGDEIEAGLRAIGPGTYKEHVGDIRQNMDEYRRAHPAAAIGAQIGGGLPLALVPGLNVAKGATLGQQVARGAVAGGAFGAAAGAGAGQGVRNRVTGGAAGAGMGAGMGGAFPLVAAGGRGALNAVRGLGNPEGVADDLVGMAIGRMGTDPADLVGSMNPGDVLADQSPGLQRLGRASQAVPNASNDAVEQALVTRSEAASEAVQEAITTRLGVDDRNVVEVAKDLASTLRRNAQGAYEKAYAAGVLDDPVLSDLVERASTASPGTRDAWQEAIALAKLEGVDISTLVRIGEDGVEFTPTVQVLDWFKRGMDSVIDKGFRGSGVSPAVARSLKTNIRNPLVQRLDELVPDYQAARAQYRGDLEMMNALKDGADAIRRTANQIADDMAGLNEAEREMFRLGYANALRRAKVDTKTGAALTRGVGSQERQLRTVFEGRDVEGFMSDIAGITRQTKTRNMTLSGSPTARIQEDVQAMAPGMNNGIMANLAKLNLWGALQGGGNQLGARMSGMAQSRVAEGVGNRLFLDKPDDVLRGLLSRGVNASEAARREAAFRLGGSAFSGLLGPAAAPKRTYGSGR